MYKFFNKRFQRTLACLLSLTIVSSHFPIGVQAMANEERNAEQSNLAWDAPGEGTPDWLSYQPRLSEVFEDYFQMGNIFRGGETNNNLFFSAADAGRRELLTHHFDVITSENNMKPRALHRAQTPTRPGNFQFEEAFETMRWADENNMDVVGHTLVWHSQSMDWLEGYIQENTSTPEEARELAIYWLERHIHTVAGHLSEYRPSVLVAWDVLNEAIVPISGIDPANWQAHLRDSKWLRLIGPDYVAIAFHAAREADPNAVLYYNDYNLNVPLKAQVVYHMVSDLRDQGVPIDRIGMQGHYQTATPMGTVRASLELFTSIPGIEVSFTEIDITVTGSEDYSELPLEMEIRQAQQYAELFLILREFSDYIPRVTFWGMADNNSWRAQQFPNLWNADLSPKLAFWAVVDPVAFLEVYPLPESHEPMKTQAIPGRPVIGDFNTDLWLTAPQINVTNQMQAHQAAVGFGRVLWDADYLYVFMDVRKNPALLDATAANAHEQDSVEVFLSNFDNRAYEYLPGDFQIRVNYQNFMTLNSGATGEGLPGFRSATRIIDTGYQVEMAIPLQGEVYSGRVLGFDLQVNDGRNGSRFGMTKWNDHTDNGWFSTMYWGRIVLEGEMLEGGPGETGPTNPVLTNLREHLDAANIGMFNFGPVPHLQGAGPMALFNVVDRAGTNYLAVTNRTEDWHAIDIVRSGLEVGDEIIVTGRSIEAATFAFDGGENPWPWGQSLTVAADTEFVMVQEVTQELMDNPGFSQIRFRTRGTHDFLIYNIEIIREGDEEPVDGDRLLWSLSGDEAIQSVPLGTTGRGTTFNELTPAMVVSGNPILTFVPYPTEANQVAIELSDRTENWNALDFLFDGFGGERGGSYRFVAYGRVGTGTGNRQFQWNRTDPGWDLITPRGQTSVPGTETEWRLDMTLDRYEVNREMRNAQRGLRLQTGNAPFLTFTVDEVRIYQVGEIDLEGLAPFPEWDLELPSLGEAFEPYFTMGNIYSTTRLMDVWDTRDAFTHHFNAITAENGHKPDHIAGPAARLTVPTPEEFDFTGADAIVNFAARNDLALVGHALVWHSQSPNWLFRESTGPNVPLTRQESKERMEFYMRTLSEHFAEQGTLGAFYSWDVVNEAIASGGGTFTGQPGSWRTQMRTNSPWFQAFSNGADTEAGEHGSDYIFYAFYFARQYFPYSILYYNDYNEEIPAKRDAIAQMVEEINEQWRNHPDYDGRLLIEAIGMQSHYHLEGWATNFDHIPLALDRFIETGARVSVTELDITLGGSGSPAHPYLNEAQLERQADAFARVFTYYLERSEALSRVSIWGLADPNSWRSNGFPLLFDENLQAKPAFHAIMDVVENWEIPVVTAPIFQTVELDEMSNGDRFTQVIEIERSSNAPVWFEMVEGNLPTGLTLHSRTGVIEGTPIEDGVFNFTIAIRNYGGETTQQFTVVIGEQPGPVAQAVTIVGGEVIHNPTGEHYEGQTVVIRATVPEGQIFSHWTVEDGDVVLHNPNALETHFFLGSANVRIVANFVDIPADPIEVPFDVILTPYDWGPSFSGVLLHLGVEVSNEDIDIEMFNVHGYQRTYRTLWDDERTVTNVFVSDRDGNPVESGTYVMVELKHGAVNRDEISWPYLEHLEGSLAFWHFVGPNNRAGFASVDYTITLNNPIPGIESDVEFVQNADFRDFITDQFEQGFYRGHHYSLYSPNHAEIDDQAPLVVWFHGIGESGSSETIQGGDPGIQVVGNRVTAFVGEEFQDIVGPSFVLVPQSNNPVAGWNAAQGPAIQALIERVIEENPGIDTNRIYIGGLSQGNVMVWSVAQAMPDRIAAILSVSHSPVPAAAPPVNVSTEVAQIPTYVIWNSNDWMANTNANHTVNRLRNAGGDPMVWMRTTPRFYINGIRFGSHDGWVYVYNNLITDEEGETIFEWMAKQSLEVPRELPCEIIAEGQFTGATGSEWRLCADGTLEVDAGRINWTSSSSPWHVHRAGINRIVFTGEIEAGPSLRALFRGLDQVEAIEGLTYFDTSQTADMSNMFRDMVNLSALDVSSFDTRHVINMDAMFMGASGLSELEVSHFVTDNVIHMGSLFRGLSNVTELEVTNFNTGRVITMANMFRDMSHLESLDLSSFNTRQVGDMRNMLNGMPLLRELTLGENFEFVGTAHLQALTRTDEFTGRWLHETGGYVFSSSQLMVQFDRHTMAGTWVWQLRD